MPKETDSNSYEKHDSIQRCGKNEETIIPKSTKNSKKLIKNLCNKIKSRKINLVKGFLACYKITKISVKLTAYSFLLSPAFLQIVWFYFMNKKEVKRNIPYSTKKRNVLDIYMSKYSKNKKKPVIIFLSGGAWMIGYKAWGSLMGRQLLSNDIIFVAPDYRNYPQGCITDMIEDANNAIQWVFDHIEEYGGDIENITLMGQSAGAHISAMVLIEKNNRIGGWKVDQLRRFIGISGPYNIKDSIGSFHEKGLHESVLNRIMSHDVSYFSPTIRLLNQEAIFPKTVALFHGTADKTVDWNQSQEFSNVLGCQDGVDCSIKYYQNYSHTDPIIEGPMSGNDPLIRDILDLINEGKEDFQLNQKRMIPLSLVYLARKVNPF